MSDLLKQGTAFFLNEGCDYPISVRFIVDYTEGDTVFGHEDNRPRASVSMPIDMLVDCYHLAGGLLPERAGLDY